MSRSRASAELAEAALVALDPVPVALLAGHGVVARAGSLADALELCALAEQQAHVEWLLRLVRGNSGATTVASPAAARSPARRPRDRGRL